MTNIVIIAGPTGVGKSEIAIRLAQKINGEIISADSIQVYKGLDIGSAKVDHKQMQGIRHHLIDVLELTDDFGVDVFVKMAGEAISDIDKRGRTPIIVGGTAFYIQALLKGIDFSEEEEHDDAYRKGLMALDEKTLYDMLRKVDSEYSDIVHMNNKKRVVRALEYYHFSGNKFSEYNKEQALRKPVYGYVYFALDDDRKLLYDRCDKRVDNMMAAGLLGEVRQLYDAGYDRSLTSMQGIGYRELLSYLDGECSLDEAVDNIKINTRHYVKRQLTWLRREENVDFVNKADFDHNDDKIIEYMTGRIKDEGFI